MQDNKKIKLEFSVDDGTESENGLVFETEKTVAPKAPTEKKSAAADRGRVSSLEFLVPDKYGASENKENKSENVGAVKTNELLGGVRHTYVPRFTDATNTPRVKDKSETHSPAKAEKKQRPEIIVVPYESAAPTSEIVEDKVLEIEDAVTVASTAPAESPEIHTVFKFDTEAEQPQEQPQIAEPASVSAEQEEIPEQESSEPKNYVLPVMELESKSEAVRMPAAIEVSDENIGDNTNNRRKPGVSEFTAPSQRDSFKDKFLDTIMSVKVRLIVSAIIFLFVGIIENLWLFGVDMPAIMGISNIPGSMAFFDMLSVVVLFLLALPEAIYSFHKLISGRAVPELYVSASALVAVAYDAILLFSSGDKYLLVGTLFGIISLSAIISNLFRKLADFETFKMISSSSDKKIVDRKLTRSLPEENLAVDGRVEGYKSKTARVYKTAFVADFFKRSSKCSENSKNTLLILGVTVGLALVSGLVAFFVSSSSLMMGGMVFATVFMLGIPVFALATHKIPFFHASCEALVENSAIIGESSLYDYAGVDVLTFRDSEIFTEEDVSLQRIMLYGKSENLEKAMHQMSALFAVVGGPLEAMFLDAIDHKAPRARNIKIEDDGIIGEVGGCEVRAGSLEYMIRNGISIPEDNTKETSSLRSTKIMYAAENGEVYAKFYIRYTLSEEFTMLLPVLLDDGITPLVYTRDPNISNDLFRTLTAGSDSIRVLKVFTLTDNDNKVYNKVSAGLVTTGDKINVINMLLLSKKYVRFQSRMAITELSSMAVGATLGIVLALTGMTVVPSIFLAAWQIAWCAALFFMSKHTLSVPIDSSRQDEK